MNFIQIRCVLEIAKTGSISKAAQNLMMAQPNLSRSIIELEKELGQKLFERDSKGVKATEFCEKFCIRANKLIEEYDSFREYLNTEEKVARFSLSSIQTAYVLEAFNSFIRKLDADVSKISLIEANTMDTLENVVLGKCDLGILRYEKKLADSYQNFLKAKNISSQRISVFNYLLTFNEECPLALKDKLAVKDLKDYIYMGQETFVTSFPNEKKRDEIPGEFKRQITISDYGMILDIVRHNKDTFFWASPLPKELLKIHHCVQRECKETGKIQFEDLLIWRNNYTLSRYDKLFLEEMNKVIVEELK